MSIVSGTPGVSAARVLAGWLCAATVHAQEAPAAPAADKFEGVLGLVLHYGPAFSGSSDFKLKPELAGFLRYGRFTVTGAGGFTTRRQDDLERGLDTELVRRDDLRVNLSLRCDRGRSEAVGGQLAGMGDIRPTVRARDPQWAAFAGASASHLLGGAAASPLTRQRTGWAVSGGLARRF
jgi:MltA-interacting protein MipA